jgi:aminoglycoside phosphotransferase (APT) family kinase protein
MVMTHVPGITWAEARAQGSAGVPSALYPQLGRCVAALQTLRFPTCGEIDADGTVTQGTPYLEALAARARRRIANPRHADLFIALLEARSALFKDMPTGVLCHDDLNPHNILVADSEGRWQVTAILDFDSAWAGSAESDLARLELWRGMTNDAFQDAYRSIMVPAAEYRERRPIYQLLWCLEYASASPRHREDTAAVCAELGIAAVTL